MTDIVERLRDKHCCDDTCYCDEAAAAIERLRAELETANANCDRMAALAIDNAKDTLRLRAVLKEMVHQFERNGMTRWPIYHAARAALAQPAEGEK